MNLVDRVKQIRRDSDPTTLNKRLESHHLTLVHFGGRTTLSNLFALTVPEHAMIHWIMANNNEDKEANSWATRQIIVRMTAPELKDFNKMIVKRQKRLRKKGVK